MISASMSEQTGMTSWNVGIKANTTYLCTYTLLPWESAGRSNKFETFDRKDLS